ncbi:MAG: glycosyltransferase [Chromatiales bacterium]|nr:MAG: glycosyltransferase [Chromatiales bacterium]
MTALALSLVIPVFNEEENVAELVERCIAVCEATGKSYEIVLVDDGSSDRSRELLCALATDPDNAVVAVLLNRNYGQHPAVLAGLAQSRGDVVVTLDADLQNPPEEIPRLLAKIDEGCDVVGSVREIRRDSWLRRLPSRLINAVVRKTTGVEMNDYGCMLRAYRRNVVDAVLGCHERSTFIPILANSFASRTGEVNVAHSERSAGDSKYNLWKLINLQFDLLTSMTAFPLRLLSIGGVLMAALGFLAGISIGIMRIVYGPEWAAEGVLTVFAVLFIFSGVQLFGLGLLGEYLSRVYDDVRARPRYFVQSVISSDKPASKHDQSSVVPLSNKVKEQA